MISTSMNGVNGFAATSWCNSAESSMSARTKPPPTAKNSMVETRFEYVSTHWPSPSINIGNASKGAAFLGR